MCGKPTCKTSLASHRFSFEVITCPNFKFINFPKKKKIFIRFWYFFGWTSETFFWFYCCFARLWVVWLEIVGLPHLGMDFRCVRDLFEDSIGFETGQFTIRGALTTSWRYRWPLKRQFRHLKHSKYAEPSNLEEKISKFVQKTRKSILLWILPAVGPSNCLWKAAEALKHLKNGLQGHTMSQFSFEASKIQLKAHWK